MLGYQNSMLLLLDEQGTNLYTIASHGYEAEGVGSEIQIGEGVIGMAAAQCTPIRLGNLTQISRYGETVRHAYEATGDIAPGHVVPFPGLSGRRAEWRCRLWHMANWSGCWWSRVGLLWPTPPTTKLS